MKSKAKIPTAKKKLILAEFHNGKMTITELSKKHHVSRQTIHAWTDSERRIDNGNPIGTRQPTWRDIYFLRTQIERQTKIIELLKTSEISAKCDLRTKLPFLAELHGQAPKKYPIHLLCEAFDVSRGAFYGYTKYGKGSEAWFVKRRKIVSEKVLKLFHESDRRFGATKITAVLREEGLKTCLSTVRNIMRENGLRSIREGAKSAYRHERTHGFPNLVNRQFNPAKPNTIWVTDVTEFELKGVKHFICAILDLYSRKAIACKIGERNSSHLVKMTIREACTKRKITPGLILHSDRGANLTSFCVFDYLKKTGITPSYSRAYTPQDNSVIEAFFKNLKTEELYRRRYRSVREFKQAVLDYIVFYNTKRPHEANGEKTPESVENAYVLKTNDTKFLDTPD